MIVRTETPADISASRYASMLVSTTAYREAIKRDPHVLVVTTSRKLIQSHDSAIAARRALFAAPHAAGVDIRVFDSGNSDLGAGLAVTLAAEASRAGRSLDAIDSLLAAYRDSARLIMVPDALDYIVKGGRATALRAFIANMLGVRPIVGIIDGEFKIAGKVGVSADREDTIGSWLENAVGGARPVWAGVFHGNAPSCAEQMLRQLERRFRVAYSVVRPLAAGPYLHVGPGSVGAVVVPTDRLPFAVPPPK